MRCFRLVIWALMVFVALAGRSAAEEKKKPHKFPDELVKFKAHKNNPVFRAAGRGHWDEQIRSRGWIVRDPDNRYYMWYTGRRKNGPDKVGYATSFDGLKWRRHRANPVYRKDGVKDVTVIERYGVFYMFAASKDNKGLLLTSPDRVHWTRKGAIEIKASTGGPSPRLPVASPSAWYGRGKWHLMYTGKKPDSIFLATSQDLKKWKPASSKPVLNSGPGKYDKKQIAVHQLFRYRGKYYMYYHGLSDTGDWTTNIAASDDLAVWEKYKQNPILPAKRNQPAGMVVYDGKQFRLYTINNEVNVYFSKRVRAADLSTN